MAELLGGALTSAPLTSEPLTSSTEVPSGYAIGYIVAYATVSWTGVANAYVLGADRRVLVPTEIRTAFITQEN